jgi:ectoine hydroxylase-related dioxygenase (phytanoyl-CoA dioxygenase family)
MLTSEQREEFDRFGIVTMRDAISRRDADEMCDRVWNALHRRHQVRRDAPETWNALRAAGTHDLPKSETFAQIGSPAICEALDDLLGRENWQRPEKWGSLLVTFPQSRDQWEVPHQSWHLDFPASRSMDALFAVRIFTCLATLQAGGGGTLFVAGSHLLLRDLIQKDEREQLRSADARKALIRSCPWVKELCSFDTDVDRIRRFMKSTSPFGEIELRVVEMTGEPGDVILTHPLLLHAPATNCAEVPRMVLSSTVYRAGIEWGDLQLEG